MKLEINLNETVEVVLTEYGAAVYNKFHEQFTHYRPANKNAGDTHRDQLWSIMQIFGPSIALGRSSPFEGNDIVFNKEIK